MIHYNYSISTYIISKRSLIVVVVIVGVDIEFVKLLCALFGFGFMSDFKLQRPAAYMELLQRFEEAKKSVSSKVRAPIVIRPPYAFIEHYLKYSDKDVRIQNNII